MTDEDTGRSKAALADALKRVHASGLELIRAAGVDSDALVLALLSKAERLAQDYLLSADCEGMSIGVEAHVTSLTLSLLADLDYPAGTSENEAVELLVKSVFGLGEKSAWIYYFKEHLEKGFFDVVEASSQRHRFRWNEEKTLGVKRYLAVGVGSVVNHLHDPNAGPLGSPSLLAAIRREAIEQFDLDDGRLIGPNRSACLDGEVDQVVAEWDQLARSALEYFATDEAKTLVEGVTLGTLRTVLREIFRATYRRRRVLQIRASHWPSLRGQGLVWKRTVGEWIEELVAASGASAAEVSAVVSSLTARPRTKRPSDFFLQAHVFVPLRSGEVVVGCSITQSLKATETLVDLLAKSDRDDSGARFEKVIAERLRSLGASAKSRVRPSGLNGDIDVLAKWENALFVFECKAEGGHLHATKVNGWRTELEAKAVVQVNRAKAFVETNPDAVARALKLSRAGVERLPVVHAIFSSSHVFDHASINGVPIRNGLRLFAEVRTFRELIIALAPGWPENIEIRADSLTVDGVEFSISA